MKNVLEQMKLSNSETYEEIIEDLIEDHLSLNPAFKESLEKSRKELASGKFITLEQLKKRL